MNIHPRGNGSIRAAEALVRPAQAQGPKGGTRPAAKVAEARKPERADHRADRLDVASPPGGGVRPADLQDRLALAGAGIEARIDNMMQHGDLSEEQLAALAEAKDSFSAILSRLGNAIGSEPFDDPSEVAKGFAFVLSQLQSDVHAALAGPDAPQATKADGVATADKLPASGVESAADMTDDAGAASPADRLDNVGQTVAARLANLAQSEGLSKQELRAIGGAEQHFQATLDRIANAIEVGGLSRGNIQSGFQAALHGLRDDVNAILGQKHGRPETGGLTGVDANSLTPEERLAAVQESIEGRLANLLANAGLDESGSAAITEAQEAFSATLERLGAAVFEHGGTSHGVLGSTLAKALAQLRQEVNAVLSGANFTPGGEVGLYGTDAGVTPLSELDTTGFDQVG
ncbi:MAG: hypothetical protein E2O39_00455 [Planctomycetota bacterium]|nr:MAG: hypothetical protein E2O39_00455 [Planctomycetota bacterium]